MIKIKKAKLSDAKILSELGSKTFYETYCQENTEGNMKKYISKAFNDKKIKEELSDENSVFFIASLNEENIGYAKISTNRKKEKLKNFKAIEFYKKWGFKPFDEEIFKLGESEQKDILMKKEI